MNFRDARQLQRFPSRTTRTRLCRWPEHRHRGPGGELEDRTVSGSGQRTGRSQGRCHRRIELARRPCCTASDHHDSHRCPKYGRSSCRWARRQPRATGRECYGANPPRPATRSQAFGLLKEALPSASQVVALWHPGAYGERTMNEMMKEAEAAGLSLGLHVRFVAVQGPDELDQAFSTIAAEHTDAIMVFPSPMLFAERGRIVDFARKLRLPLISMGKQFVELGGLLSYGADIIRLHPAWGHLRGQNP